MDTVIHDVLPCRAPELHPVQIAEPPLSGSDAPSRKRASLCIPTNAQSAASSIPPLSQIPRSKPQAGWRASFDRWRNSRDQAPACEAMGHGRRCQAEGPGRQRRICSTCCSSARPAHYVSKKEGVRFGYSTAQRTQDKSRSARKGCYRGSTTPIACCGSFECKADLRSDGDRLCTFKLTAVPAEYSALALDRFSTNHARSGLPVLRSRCGR